MRALASATPVVPGVQGRTSTERDTDVDLVARVRAGEDVAFERLYERYHRRIAAYIYGMVQDYGRAEDIAQDVFLSALRRMRETDRPLAFKPWVYEIAKNACIDQFRRSRRAEEVSYDAEEGLGAADYGKLVMGGPSPEVAVDQKMSLDHLRGAFSGLSQTHHEILVMRELEGLSYREIGERLGMSRPSVESTLFRARRRLSEEYEELISGARCLRVQQIISTATTGALGARDGRKLAAHVSHCQPCRRHAKVAGVDDALLLRPGVAAKIAAFLPLPAFLKRRWDGTEAGGASSVGSTWVANAPTIAGYAEPAMGWVKAAAVAATVAAAGVGASQVGPTAAGLGQPGKDDREGAAAQAASDRSSGAGQRGRTAAATSGRTAARAGAGATSTFAPRGGTTSSTSASARDNASTGARPGTSTTAAGAGSDVVGGAGAPALPSTGDAGDTGGSSGLTELTDSLDPTKQPNASRPSSGTPAPPADEPEPPTIAAPVQLPDTLGDSGASQPAEAVTGTAGEVTTALGDALKRP